jgi:hypothetical protein
MPTRTPTRIYHCPACDWSKNVAPRSDAARERRTRCSGAVSRFVQTPVALMRIPFTGLTRSRSHSASKNGLAFRRKARVNGTILKSYILRRYWPPTS